MVAIALTCGRVTIAGRLPRRLLVRQLRQLFGPGDLVGALGEASAAGETHGFLSGRGRALLDESDLIVGEAVEVVDQAVDAAIGRVGLPLKACRLLA